MRTIGTEMINFGFGLPVLYFAFAGVVLNSLRPAGAMVVGVLSFLLIALGREIRVRAAQPNNESADAARLVRSNASGDAVDDDTHPSDLGSTEGFETREIGVRPAALGIGERMIHALRV